MKKKTTKAQEVHRDYVVRGFLLDAREKDIIEKYYGFGEQMKHTLEEIGSEYKISKERIRQIKHHAIQKIKQNEKQKTINN